MANNIEIQNNVMQNYVDVFLGLGSNLDNPVKQIETAIMSLQQLPDTVWQSVSSLYQSAAMTMDSLNQADTADELDEYQPDYINAVANVKTKLSAIELLDKTMQIERQQKRIREKRWGPRTLDIDLLLYGAEKINTSRLTVPHPGMHQRSFVLLPLSELVPENFLIPGFGSLHDILSKGGDYTIKRLDKGW